MLGCEGGTGQRYCLTLVTGLVECLCFAGVVFGYASLVFVLKEDEYFQDLCVNVTGANSTLVNTGESETVPPSEMVPTFAAVDWEDSSIGWEKIRTE